MVGEELTVVRLRDNFYRDGFSSLLLAIALVIAACGLLISLSCYLIFTKPKPVTFATFTKWQTMVPAPLNQPYLSTADMLQWVSTTLPKVFGLDFLHYSDQLKQASPYFTSNGWKKFLDILNSYVAYNTVQSAHLFVNGVANGAPYILSQGLAPPDNRFAWLVQMPVNIVYNGADRYNIQELTFQVLVVRVPNENNLSGVGIDSIQLVTPAPSNKRR